MTDPDPIVTHEPHDRLTRLAAAMTETFDAHPEHAVTDKCILFVQAENRGGLVIHDYDDQIEAIADLFMHLKAMFRAVGKDIDFIGIPNDVSGITP